MIVKKKLILRSILAYFLWCEVIGLTVICSPKDQVFAQETVNITQINNIADQSSGFGVYLQGEVIEKVPFLGRGAYALSDGTGIIWILTDQAIPNTGEIILIQGEIQYQSIAIEGQEIGEFYIKQVRRLDPDQYIAQTLTIETTLIATPPIETPPIETPPIETPPIETPPIETPPIETPPVETAVVEMPVVELPLLERPQPRKLPFEPQFMPHK